MSVKYPGMDPDLTARLKARVESAVGTAAQEAEENSAKIVQLIEVRLRRRGQGTPEDPLRIIREYWTFDGRKVAEADPTFTDWFREIESLRRRLRDAERAGKESDRRIGQFVHEAGELHAELVRKEVDVRNLKAKLLEVTRPERSKKFRARKAARKRAATKKTRGRK